MTEKQALSESQKMVYVMCMSDTHKGQEKTLRALVLDL